MGTRRHLLGEDACHVRSEEAPQTMVALRTMVLALLHGAGWTNLATALRNNAWQLGVAPVVLALHPP